MKILVLTNLYPPHHAGTYNYRCPSVVEALKLRGHVVLVLTSNHGLTGEQRDGDVERRLWLNGVFDHPERKAFGELQALEIHNHLVLNETITDFQPEIIFVWSLHGLSKSLLTALRICRIPYAFDVEDHWISNEVREDPWLWWWNCDKVPLSVSMMRRTLELSAQRDRIDKAAPTRCQAGVDRMPGVFGKPPGELPPDSIGQFHFNRAYFCSHALKQATMQAGFRVSHAEIILPGIPTRQFHGEIKPPSVPLKKLMICSELHPKNGVMTALDALQILQGGPQKFTLDIYGRGDSDYVAQLRSYVAMHELPVHFLTVSNLSKDMPPIYRLHDAFLHTCEWDDPFAHEPIEAMACGLPIIGTTCGGVGEFLKHGVNGLTFTAGDAGDLAARILELHANPELRGRMADAAQQDVLASFDETTIVDQIENYLNGTVEIWSA